MSSSRGKRLVEQTLHDGPSLHIDPVVRDRTQSKWVERRTTLTTEVRMSWSRGSVRARQQSYEDRR